MEASAAADLVMESRWILTQKEWQWGRRGRSKFGVKKAADLGKE